MSGRDWKPGDVAVSDVNGTPHIIFRAEDSASREVWHDKFGPLLPDSEWPTERVIRPLVVIDPEDREQVERLDDLIYADRNDRDDTVDGTQAALREFVTPTPPKPPEPQGLGAVVEDDDGWKWVRVGSGETSKPWVNEDSEARWDNFRAVRVLSEGVTS